jgi:PEP-CTERM motif-containing protein
VQTTGDGTPLPELPLVAFTTINRFEDAARTPEPASMLLVGTGIAALFAGRRRASSMIMRGVTVL